MTEASATVFPDTNALLHYPPIKEIDWKTVCDADSVKIVLCMQVIHELDEKKSHPRLSERAKRTIKEISFLRNSDDPVNEGVTIEIYTYKIDPSDFPDTMRIDEKDDRIMRQVMKYIEDTHEHNVIICSEDYGMQLCCEEHGLVVIEPDKSKRLEDPLTHEQKEYRRALIELADLKNKRPELELIVCKPDDEPIANQPIKFVLSRSIDFINVNQAVENERRRIGIPVKPHSFMGFGEIPQEDWDKYLQELDNYYPRYKTWVELVNRAKDEQARRIGFMLHIKNSGKFPAEDVGVSLNFPPIFLYIKCQKDIEGRHPTYPEKPKPPREPKSVMLSMAEIYGSGGGIRGSYIPESFLSNIPYIPKIWDPTFYLEGEPDVGFLIRVTIPKLNHFVQQTFGPFELMFNSWDDVNSFNVNRQIIAANLPEKIESEIPFLIDLT